VHGGGAALERAAPHRSDGLGGAYGGYGQGARKERESSGRAGHEAAAHRLADLRGARGGGG
jgi:hypothetical protein